ncbi:putative outer membrane receptor for iron transport [Nitrosomonas europaea ATCC 19718]|uniref:Putative outer membrane receptor for iron transport n=1 Tax=Nitrosomonas europaea (strain ATCC 19718 / CIP 103999 / KCTC 2705 / NBRC 14298) TaxID=228410 RepID=Q82S56_NITEU|nr:putative outer membrane receptor for iron transport [Nitrosomonas europaea ATCC 19718]
MRFAKPFCVTSRMRALALLLLFPSIAAAQEMPTTTLAPVVVQATRLGASIADTPASVDVIDGRQLRARQPGINLSEGLVSVPGL